MLKYGIALVFLVAVTFFGVGIYAAVCENVRHLDSMRWCIGGALFLLVGLYWAHDYDSSVKKIREKNE